LRPSGNTMLIKPSEKDPGACMMLVELAKQAGMPEGVVNVIHGQHAAVDFICDNPDIHAISFVGSDQAGTYIYERGSKNGKRVQSNMGAKNHGVIMPDANKESTLNQLTAAAFGAAGQRCMAASVLLTVGEQKSLVDAIIAKAKKLKAGQKGGEVGPVIDADAQSRIIKYITEAEKSGCKILLDGRSWADEHKGQGWWVGPTIIQHTSEKDPGMCDEIFGPVLSLMVVESKERAIEIENNSPYGNAACIYTSVGAHADWFTRRFSVGHVGVNIGVPVPREPFSFGGWNASKFGDCDITGDGGLEFWTKRKKVTTKWTPPPTKDATSWMS